MRRLHVILRLQACPKTLCARVPPVAAAPREPCCLSALLFNAREPGCPQVKGRALTGMGAFVTGGRVQLETTAAGGKCVTSRGSVRGEPRGPSLGAHRRPAVVWRSTGFVAREGRCGRCVGFPDTRTPEVRVHVAVGQELLAGGGDGGRPRGPRGPGRKTGEEEGGGKFNDQTGIIDMLMKAGASMSDLPVDLQVALREGLLTFQDIKQWLTLASTPILGSACKAMPAVRDRVMGNPRFLLQVLLELGLGLAAKTSAELRARGDNFFKEIPFVMSDLALEVLGDLSMVWLLSPRRSFKRLPAKGLARKIAMLPGHCYQSGNFSLGQRGITILYRGSQFFMVGFATSMVGHSLTKWAVENQAKGLGKATHLAPVLDNSLGWGAFMGMSSNMRYQLVNGIEERVLDVFVPNRSLNSLATLGIRFTNCFIGGVQWVWFAKQAGLQ